LLNHVLNNRHGLKVTVIVSDMSEVNIDADLIHDGGTSVGIRARLDACLVPGRPAMDVAEWAKLPDPFPAWRRADQAA